MILMIYLVACLVISLFAKQTQIGFLGFFIISVLITPILSGFFLLVCKIGKDKAS
jgi:hypothetical protein